MRKHKWIATATALVFSALLVIGCSNAAKDVEIEINDGENKIKVSTTDGKTVVYKDKDQKSVVTISEDIDVKKFGNLAYPGMKSIGGGSMDSMGEGGSALAGNFMSKDPVEKVAAFYKEKIKGATVIDQLALTGAIVFMKQESDKVTNVSISNDTDDKNYKSLITISIINLK